MKAIIWPNRIDILGAALPKDAWEPLLDDLQAEHVPALTPTGKRLSAVVGPGGRIDAFVYRTHEISDAEVVRILAKYGIAAEVGSDDSHAP